ncbi:autophagy-related protein 18b [Dendrobium catenatum]|uniref:Autophagy-related protein 18b n=1 Tax=Dendrobium catenatum TaxID=906689 RepID=A0A2I0VTK0_9ASPA|nr:autophagy-related protein 18b [Dendrobium catenatum]PKU66747.1 Autophagy-related protein 18b [Dendrobium catenatum]
MASSSSGSRILCASFNQDNSCFAIGTKDGFRLFDAQSGSLRYERAIGAFSIVEMLFSTSLIAIVGAGEQPSLSPRRLCLFNFITGSALRELNFLTTILAVRINRKRLIVVLQEKTYIYDINSLAILDTIDTVPNNKGLCAFSPNSEACYLALPASTTKGSALVYNTLELQSLCQIDAHRSPLAAVVFSSNGMYLATASEQGTIIRVHLVSQATKSYSLRRGSYPSTIYSLSFGPSVDLPDILVATSLSGSLHAFSLGPIIEQRNRRPNKLLGSMIPEPINDAFESSYHHVVHNVSIAGIKSYVTISSTDKVQSSSPNSTIRSNVYIITGDGHFYNYTLNITSSNELSCNLQSEFNLIDTVVEDLS